MNTLTHAFSKERKINDIKVQEEGYVPVRILEVEISQPIPNISAIDEKTHYYYQRARCLVRLHTQPLGIVEFSLDENGMNADEYAAIIWRSLQVQINEHLRQDGLSSVVELGSTGLPSLSTPRCVHEREIFLTDAPFVSVIVPTHNRPDRISECLHSLLSLDYPHYEVIIVDNAPSSNATADFIHKHYRDVPRVRYVREDRPGPSFARNCGMMVARGKILAFPDDDVVVDRYWLVELVKAFSLFEDVACVTGLVLPLKLETAAQFWFEEYGGFSKGFNRRIFDMKENHPKTLLHPYSAGSFGTGASMAFKAAFLRSIGGFDPAFGGNSAVKCGEDIVAFFQVITKDYKLVYEPAAILYHLHRRGYTALQKQMYNYGVGLTAYLLNCILDNPRLLFDFVTKVPYGIFFILSGRSPKNRKKTAHYPKELTKLELRGMLYGPFAYFQSRWAMHKVRKIFTSIEENSMLPVTKEIQEC
jgi:GT2 family glycosyltransferase